MHNGYISEFPNHQTRPSYWPPTPRYLTISEQADTEVLFHLASASGSKTPQPGSSAIGLMESATSRRRAPHPYQGTVAATDGETIWAG